jgi:hypothetical protein
MSEQQSSADSEPIAWATPIADGTHQLTRHEEVAGRWRDCNLKVIELYARPQPERAEPQSLPLRGPDCACCEQRPRKDCTVPGCTMKDAGWALERSQAVCEDGQ